MNPVFDRTAIAEIRDPDLLAHLADTLDSPLPLLKFCWVPRQVDVDEGAEALEVEALGGGIGPEEQLKLTRPHPFLEQLSVAALESACAPEAGPVAASVKTDVLCIEGFVLG